MPTEHKTTAARYRWDEPVRPPVTAWMMMDPQGRLIVHAHTSERVAWMSKADPGEHRRQMRRAGWRAVQVRIEVVT